MNIKLSQIKSIDNTLFRGSIIEKDNSQFRVVLSPSEYIFGLPEVGDVCLTVHDDYSFCRSLFPLNKSVQRKGMFAGGDEELHQEYGNLMTMSQGDFYVGRYGRGYFSSSVSIFSENNRSVLNLWDDGISELRGYNFKISSEDEGISIYSYSSVPLDSDTEDEPTFGDNLVIQRNTVDNGSSSIKFFDNGSILIDVLSKDNLSISKCLFDIDGSFKLSIIPDRNNQKSELNLNSEGDFLYTGRKVDFNLSDSIDFKYKNFNLSGETTNISSKLNLTGDFSLNGKGIIKGSELKINAKANISDDLTVKGKATISGGLTLLNLGITGPITIAGQQFYLVPININGIVYKFLAKQ